MIARDFAVNQSRSIDERLRRLSQIIDALVSGIGACLDFVWLKREWTSLFSIDEPRWLRFQAILTNHDLESTN